MKTARFPLIDSLRGLMLVSMTIVHLPGVLGGLLDEPLGFIGTSEGFVFISAILVGLLTKEGRIIPSWRYFLSRAFLLCVFHFGVFAILLLSINFFSELHSYWREFGIRSGLPLRKAVPAALLLVFQPRYLDILPLFIVSLLLCPALLYFLGRRQLLAVLLLSGGLWLAGHTEQFSTTVHAIIIKSGLSGFNQSHFNLASWQLLFILGVSVGYHHSEVNLLFKNTVARRTITLLAIIFLAICIAWRHGLATHPFTHETFKFLVFKPNLGVFRITQLLAVTFLVRLLYLRLGGFDLPSPLAFLGRYSLSVYSFHVLLVYAVAPWRGEWHESWPLTLQLSVTMLIVTALFIPAFIHRRLRQTYRLRHNQTALGTLSPRVQQ